MIVYENTLVRKYEEFLREIVNSSVNRIDWTKLESQEMMFVDKMKELFKLQNSESWGFLTSSLDVLGSSHLAIITFLNFGNENHTHLNIGERYLRLNGVLSSVYIHFGAISTLTDLIKIKNKNIEKEFKSLNISFLRNAISAHPVNFELKGEKTHYKTARYSLNDLGALKVLNHKNEINTFDLSESLNTYIKFSEKLLEKTIKKIIQNRYDSSPNKKEDLIKKLDRIKMTAPY